MSNTTDLDGAMRQLLREMGPKTYEERLEQYNSRLEERKRNERVARKAAEHATHALETIYAIQALAGYRDSDELAKARKHLAVFREDIESWLVSPIPPPPVREDEKPTEHAS